MLVSHDAIIDRISKDGYQLLRCLRAFQILDIHMAFEVHTEDTIASLRCALLDWESNLSVSPSMLKFVHLDRF